MKFIHISGVYTECNGDIKFADFYVNADKVVSFSVLSVSERRLKVSCEGWSRPLIVDGDDATFLADCTGRNLFGKL
jgi:hypothetical protein